MNNIFIFLVLLHQLYAAGYQIKTGTILEDVGETRFITSYLDLRLDVSCSFKVYQQLLYFNSSLNDIHSFINNTLQKQHLIYNSSLIDLSSSKLENIHIMAKLSVQQQKRRILIKKTNKLLVIVYKGMN